MKIKTKLFFVMTVTFTVFIAFIWFYTQSLSDQINERWGERFIHKQITFDKYRTLLPILNEINLAKKLSTEPTIIAMAKYENDPIIRANGLKTLEHYRIKFQDRSYFTAFTRSGNYYFNDSSNQFSGRQLRYVLSPHQAKDKWFYETIKLGDAFQINVNKDNILGVNKVWINYVLRDHGKIIGVIGTGFDFDQFLKQSVGIEQEGVRNFFIKKDLSIQLAKDTQMIDYASMTKTDGTHKTIDMVFKDPLDIQHIKEAITSLEEDKNLNSVKTLWVDIEGTKHLLGIAYQRDVGWFSLTLFDSEELSLVNNKNIFIFLSLFFMGTLIIIGFMLKLLVVSPIEKLKKLMIRVEKGEIENDLPIIGSGEIAELSDRFNGMVKEIQEHNLTLEEKIQERTSELIYANGKLNAILEAIPDLMFELGLDGTYYDYHSPRVDLLAASAEVFIGKKVANIMPLDAANICLKGLSEANISGHCEGLVIELDLDVGKRWFELSIAKKISNVGDKQPRFIVLSRDITLRKKAEEEIRELAFYDSLTSLPNRRLLSDRLFQAQIVSKRSGYYGAVLFMDLDNFKPLNDTYGHTIGDLLLIQVAQRIRSCLRESDTVARFGGDEFIVLLSELSEDKNASIDQAMVIAEKIRHSLAHPYFLKIPSNTIEEKIVEHHCSASIGCTLFFNHEATQDEIFNQADSAMYTAKENGRNRVHFYA